MHNYCPVTQELQRWVQGEGGHLGLTWDVIPDRPRPNVVREGEGKSRAL